jgi:general stress protein 26
MVETRSSEGLSNLADLIAGIEFAMLTTVGQEGLLRSRPMTTLEGDIDEGLFFFVSRNGALVRDIRAEKDVNVSYADPRGMRFVSVAGRARLVEDRALMQRLWKAPYRTYFPGGLDDPDLALLEVTIEEAESWDAASNRLVAIAGLSSPARGLV